MWYALLKCYTVIIVDLMVATILAWQRDLNVLHHSQGRIVANCSYLGGSVPTFDIKNITISG